MNELAIAGIDADVGSTAPYIEKYQIAGAQVARVDGDGLGNLAF